MTTRILLVEDDQRLAELTAEYLSRNDLDVTIEARGDVAETRILAEQPDLVILDVMLPGKDGFEVCRAVRQQYRGVILMLTARDEDFDQILGLELGADDYIVKPFEPRELVARVRSILRRYQRAASADATERNTARFAGWTFDASRHTLAAPDGREIPLSAAEAGLLATLLRRPNKILSRERLLGERDVDPFDRSIDVRISRLRRKLDDDPHNPRLIKTVYGAGYLFSAQVEWL